MYSFKSRVSCTFSDMIFQSKNIISWYIYFFASALQCEALFMLLCGIQFLSCKSYVKRPCAPSNLYLLSNFTCLWYLSISTWCAESENTWKFTNFCWVTLFAVRLNRPNSFFQPSGFRCRSLSILIFQKKSWWSLFLFQLETWEQCSFSSENFAVNLYPIKVLARAFEWNVAIIFVVSISCGSDSHWVTWFIASLCSVFWSFSSQS